MIARDTVEESLLNGARRATVRGVRPSSILQKRLK